MAAVGTELTGVCGRRPSVAYRELAIWGMNLTAAGLKARAAIRRHARGEAVEQPSDLQPAVHDQRSEHASKGDDRPEAGIDADPDGEEALALMGAAGGRRCKPRTLADVLASDE